MSISSYGQIKISDVGDGWKIQVEEAIELVQKTDPDSYKILIDNCKNIEFMIGTFSTTRPPHTIVINTMDLKKRSINNLAAILVHESYHLYYWNNDIQMEADLEELMCYKKEYSFLTKLPDVEDWLFLHTMKQIIHYTHLVTH
jgi:hypothetical protein